MHDDDLHSLTPKEEKTMKLTLVAGLVLAIAWLGIEAVTGDPATPVSDPPAKSGARSQAISQGAFGDVN